MHSKSCHVGSLWQSHTLKIINTPIDRCGGSILGVFNLRGWMIQRLNSSTSAASKCHIDPHFQRQILRSGAGDIDWFNAKRQLLGVVMHQGGRLDVQVDLCCERGTKGGVFSVWKSSACQVARFLINPAGEQVRIQLRITLELG